MPFIAQCKQLVSLDLRDIGISSGIELIISNCPYFNDLRIRNPSIDDKTIYPLVEVANGKYGKSNFKIIDMQNCPNIGFDSIYKLIESEYFPNIKLINVTHYNFTYDQIKKLKEVHNNKKEVHFSYQLNGKLTSFDLTYSSFHPNDVILHLIWPIDKNNKEIKS